MSEPVRPLASAAASPALVEPNVTTRPSTADDEEFLLAVYASTRFEELAPLGWSDADRDAFLRQQGQAQHQHYRTYYPGADYAIVLADGQPAGRLYVARWPHEIRLMDVALLPAFRNAGIGTRLVRRLIAESRTAGKPLSCHVESFNPARRLYERLGFRPVEDKGVYQLMVYGVAGPVAESLTPSEARAHA